ncbi:MAG: hypothetical protein DBX91_00460 [Subdoligranulum variabile]|nr:MAG: hypothetical protein DBX91_00460 [Subdoligranulum variabile]
MAVVLSVLIPLPGIYILYPLWVFVKLFLYPSGLNRQNICVKVDGQAFLRYISIIRRPTQGGSSIPPAALYAKPKDILFMQETKP